MVAIFTTFFGSAQFGTLDLTFGVDGKVSTEFGDYKSAVKAIALQQDGKIVAVGSTFNNSTYHRYALARYNADGSLDQTFGTEGKIVGDFPDEKMALTSVFVQPDGKIVASGIIYNQYFDSEFVMIRFNEDGSVDTGFGTNGMVIEGQLTINSVKMLSDGKILAAGFNSNPTGSERHIAVLRFNSDGSIDTSFAQNGYYITSLAQKNFANAMQVLPDGKIVIGGVISNNSLSDFCVIRLMPDGNTDPDFGQDGFASFDYDITDEITSLCVQPDGKIVFSGYTGDTMEYHYAVMRLNENGTIDHSFGDDGLVTGTGGSMAKNVEVEASGKILVAGSYGEGSSKTASMLRFNADGSLDAEFGENGLITTAFSSSCQANAMTLQSDGKIILGGEAGSTGGTYNPNFALMRYHSGTILGVHDRDFAGSFVVYPNPVADAFHIDMNLLQSEKLTIELLDMNGRKICSLADNAEYGIGMNSGYFTLPSGLQRGTYLLNISNGRDNSVLRIIK